MSCSFSCLATSSCGNIHKVPPGAVLAPFVTVGFEGAGEVITVGNQSSKDGRAFIKSFEYGVSDGAGTRIEILDEEGGKLKTFVDRLSKSVCNAPDDYKMFIDFGWVITHCDGSKTVDRASDYGNRILFLPIQVESNFDAGKFRHVITGVDFQDRIAENRIEKNYGTEDNKMTLKEALRRMFRDNCPSVEIRFERKDGSTWDFKNSDGGPEGPRAVWKTDQQNAMASARKWLERVSTSSSKGILLQWKPDEPKPTLIFLEDPNPAPGENFPPCDRSIGTYIVNGSDCSPVLGFSAKFNWVLGANAGSGGNLGGGSSGNHAKFQGREGSRIEKVGTQSHAPIDENENMYRPQDQSASKGVKANAAHEAAVRFREIPSSIEADLKLVGDPALAYPLGGVGIIAKTAALVVINPFFIRGGSQCDWVAKPPCNELLSNKNWLIMGMNHQIREGSYVTTLKLRLDAPNADIEPDMPLGGSGTVTFRNARPGEGI